MMHYDVKYNMSTVQVPAGCVHEGEVPALPQAGPGEDAGLQVLPGGTLY